MSDTSQCGYCRSTNIRNEHLDGFSVYYCLGCGSRNWQDGHGPRASEEEMATGWSDNLRESACFSAFAPVPQRENLAVHAHSAKWWLK